MVVSHGGVITALERAAGEEWRQLANLEARWFEFDAASGDLRPHGDRVRLLPTEPIPAETIERYA